MSDPSSENKPSSDPPSVAAITVDAPGSAQSNEVAFIQSIAGALDAFTRPFAEADKAKAKEETRRVDIEATARIKQIEIQTDLQKHNARIVAGLAIAVFLFALVALLTGNATMAEKIVIAAVGFLGGYGFGRTQAGKSS